MEASETVPQEAQSPNEGRIALWPAKNREVGDNNPYLTGRVTIEGKQYLVTLWKRERTSDRQPTLSGHIIKEEPLEV